MTDTVELTVVEQTIQVSLPTNTISVTQPGSSVTLSPVTHALEISPPAQPTVTVSGVAPAVTVSPTANVVEVSGLPGPRGPQGEKGDKGDSGNITSSLAIEAGEALGGHRVVRSSGGLAYYASSAVTAHRGTVIGITTGAVSSGDSAGVAAAGEITEPSWNWTDGNVYLSTNGLLTQTAPTSGFLQVIGIVLEPTRLLVALGEPTVLL
jgi:hypothetical protein